MANSVLLTRNLSDWQARHLTYENQPSHFWETESWQPNRYVCAVEPGKDDSDQEDEETPGQESEEDENFSLRDVGSGSGGAAGARTGFDDYYINPETDVDNDTYIGNESDDDDQPEQAALD